MFGSYGLNLHKKKLWYDARGETRILLANLKTKKTKKKKKKDNMIYDHINILFRMSIKIKILIFFYLLFKI